MPPTTTTASDSNMRWVMLGLLFVSRSVMGFQFQSIAATAPLVAQDFKLDPTQIGTLIGFYMVPGIVIALPGGFLGRWLGEKRSCLLGLACMAAGGVLTALAGDYTGLAIGRIVSGCGAVVFNLVLTNMVVGWFAGREVVTALAIILACWPISIGAALVGETALSLTHGWRFVMLGTAVGCMVSLLLLLLLYRSPPLTERAAEPLSGSARLTLREASACGVAGLLWGSFNAGLVIFYSFTPALLREHAWQPLAAGSITSIGLWVSALSLPLGGWLAERWQRPTAAIVLSCSVSGIALLLLPTMIWPVGLSLLLGLAIGPGPGPIVALPPRAVSGANRVIGFGLFYAVYYLMVAVGPIVAGWGQNLAGSASVALFIGGALYLVSVPLLGAFEAIVRGRPVASNGR